MARFYGVPKQVAPRGGVTSSVKLVGVPQLLAKLRAVNTICAAELGLLTMGVADKVYKEALENVPTVTGNLKTGIKLEKGGVAYNWTVSASSVAGTDPAGVGKNKKEYAGFVEFGTSKMAPRSYMTKAWGVAAPLGREGLQVIASKLEAL